MYMDTLPSDYSSKYIDTDQGEKTMYKKQNSSKNMHQKEKKTQTSSLVMNAIGSGILYAGTFYHLAGFTGGAQNVSIAIVQSIVLMQD